MNNSCVVQQAVVPDDAPATNLPQGASSTSQAMDESSRPEHERPEGDDTARAPKQTRMNVISDANMHEDMDPDLSQEAFGEDVRFTGIF